MRLRHSRCLSTSSIEWHLIERFISFVEPQNIASMGLLRKLEYRDMGYVPEIESQMFGKWTN